MIRHANILDVEQIVPFVKQFYPITPYANQAEFDDETVAELSHRLVRTGIVLLAVEEGKIIGILAAHVVPFMFNCMVLSCNEAIWYVTPEHQKSGIGLELIQRADKIRKLRNCKIFQMMRVAGSPEKLDQVFESLGFTPSEFCWTKVD